MMDYPCAKFGDLVSAVLAISCGQTDRITGALAYLGGDPLY